MSDPIEEYLNIISTVREFVEDQMDLGFSELIEPKRKIANLDFQDLGETAMSCVLCELNQTRTHVVFGEGDANADLMFVGEAPGKDEDQQGRPFVGRSGQLLTKIIESMGFSREEVYIANVVKCRPPNNRNPKKIEIETCEPFLIRQIELIKPKVICALGTFATQMLLKTDEKISRLRGKFHDYHGLKVMPTYHPAYLLRNPNGKRDVWEDVQKIMAILDKPNPE